MNQAPEFDGSPLGGAPSTAWAELNQLSDAALMERLVAGDSSALAVVFDRYHRLVFSVAARILRDEAEAEDVVQTVFLNIFQSAAKFNPLRGTLKVWLLQYAYHRSINRRRKLTVEGVYLWDELDADNAGGPLPQPEALRFCEQMLERLKPVQREVLELTYFEGRTAQEIALKQNRPLGHVRHDLYRGLAKLRSAFGKPGRPPVRAESDRAKSDRAKSVRAEPDRAESVRGDAAADRRDAGTRERRRPIAGTPFL